MRVICVVAAFVCCCLNMSAQGAFDKYFEASSLRIDFVLTGNTEYETGALYQLRQEPVWAGPRINLIDDMDMGGYYARLYDLAGGELIYARGFNTLFEEWRTTEQAVTETQSWINSVSVPFPKNKAVFELLVRDRADNRLKPVMKQEIDPESIFIDRGGLNDNRVTKVEYNGDPSGKIDLVFLAEGYRADEMGKFDSDVERFTEALFVSAPFDKHRKDFNVWSVGLVSADSGCDVSGKGVFKNTALNSGFYTFGTERYLTTADMKAVRDAVWNVPCDAVFILVNTDKYGGGGMYNFYGIGSADNERTIKVFVHELGHSFGGLADEYFSSEVAYSDFYSLKLEPWEPNITTLVDFGSKWQDMLPAGTPVPTPLDDKYKDGLGVFEGGGYVAKGIYRPLDHCMMRDSDKFCPVCERAIVRMIRFMTDK